MFSAQPVIIQTLRVIRDLVENVLPEITQTKRLCYECTKDHASIALWLFPLYVDCPDVCHELFAFFHAVFDVLKAQMGVEAVEKAVHTFLHLFNKDIIVRVREKEIEEVANISFLIILVIETELDFHEF